MTNRQSTHAHNCWDWGPRHYECAVGRIKRLEEALREAYNQVRELCDCYAHPYPEASFNRYKDLLRDQEKKYEQ